MPGITDFISYNAASIFNCVENMIFGQQRQHSEDAGFFKGLQFCLEVFKTQRSSAQHYRAEYKDSVGGCLYSVVFKCGYYCFVRHCVYIFYCKNIIINDIMTPGCNKNLIILFEKQNLIAKIIWI